MATCKECIHSECCFMQYGKTNALKWQSELGCKNFKDRSRFVELPCKVGDSVFCLNPNCTFHAVRVDGANVELITSQGFILNQSLIGKTVFLTREEAEQALKEREENA